MSAYECLVLAGQTAIHRQARTQHVQRNRQIINNTNNLDEGRLFLFEFLEICSNFYEPLHADERPTPPYAPEENSDVKKIQL